MVYEYQRMKFNKDYENFFKGFIDQCIDEREKERRMYRDYTEDDLKEVVLLMDDYQIPEDAIDKRGHKVLLSLKDRVLMALDNVRNGRY